MIKVPEEMDEDQWKIKHRNAVDSLQTTLNNHSTQFESSYDEASCDEV